MAKRNLKKLTESLKGDAKANPGAGLSVEESPANIITYQKGIIKEVTNPFWKDVGGVLIPALERLEPQYNRNYMANSQASSEMAQLIRLLGDTWGDIGPTADNLATKWAADNDTFHRDAFVKFLQDATGISVGDILTDRGIESQLESAIQTNAELIKSIPKVDLERIEDVIMTGLRTGNDFRSLRKEVMQIGNADERRAKLIARDQTSKLNGNLNRIRQLDVGITGYFWRVTGDGPPRVRPTHWANRNKRFRWDSPPSKTGHPGHDVNCRCYADPDLRGLRLS